MTVLDMTKKACTVPPMTLTSQSCCFDRSGERQPTNSNDIFRIGKAAIGLVKIISPLWVGITYSQDAKAAVQNDFQLSGRYPAHCRPSMARTPTAAVADQQADSQLT